MIPGIIKFYFVLKTENNLESACQLFTVFTANTAATGNVCSQRKFEK